ncbi:MAG: Transcriptional regulator, family [Bacteroidota bacterium]|nr:Transcriptional regulator, family [Bacteroidota bacterium]
MNNLRNEKLLVAFGLHLKQLRLKKGLTQEQLAYACDMELSQVYRIEKGKINVTISTLSALAVGLETSIGQLLKDF